jgi:glycosyltransferase involved in cell wall biosynthesis
MKILYTIHAYGLEVTGGAETHCRLYAEHMAAEGHDIHVVTSCARSYVGWANEFTPGTEVINGVTVHRLPVRHERIDSLFGGLDQRVVWGRRPVPKLMQDEWLRTQGPEMVGFEQWLLDNALDFDIVISFTYLYCVSSITLRTLAGKVPLLLYPLAHEEPHIKVPVFRELVKLPDVIAFNTIEEGELIERELGIYQPSALIGVGMSLDQTGDPNRFRERFGLGDDPYLLYIGRVDPNKGSEELYEFYIELMNRIDIPLRLVIMGEQVRPLPPHDGVVNTGYVDEQTKFDGLSGALALAMPSYFESFSMVLTEGWSVGIPAVVQGHCAVLRGQCMRSGGGIPYRGFAEFGEAVKMLLEDPELARQLGAAGKKYTAENYSWPVILDRYEKCLRMTIEVFEKNKAERKVLVTA